MTDRNMNKRVKVVCVRCGEDRVPVIRVMRTDGLTPESYVCASCRAETGRAAMRLRERGVPEEMAHAKRWVQLKPDGDAR